MKLTQMRMRLSGVALHAVFILSSLFFVLPIVLVVAVSLTNEQDIIVNGYSFIPEHFSFEAYRYLFADSATIIRSYGITITVTVIGTIAGLVITAMFAYPLSRGILPYRGAIAFYAFFTMLFNGGLVPWYLVYTNFMDIRDSLIALIIPNLLMNAFYIMIMRTFFSTTIPGALIESAHIDGAGEFRIFLRIVLPLSLPVLATVGLFNTLAYWNDWFNSLVFINEERMYSLQYLLNRILLDLQFLKNNVQMSGKAQMTANMPTETVRMAMAVVGMGPIILAYPFFQRYLVKGLTIGAVKG